MKAVISVVGRDRPGILAFVANQCADRNINIEDVTQKILQDMFTMVMIVNIPEDLPNFGKLTEEIEKAGEEQGLKIHLMHEDIFNAMHTI
ncbi:MAG: ACT domain-containing protein [Bulleidia sp.]